MSWFYDNPDVPAYYEHEGFIIALTFRTKDTPHEFRELRYPDNGDYGPEAIARIQAACACGWRSQYFIPRCGVKRYEDRVFRLPRWSPYVPWLIESDEERCKAIWAEHVHQAVTS